MDHEYRNDTARYYFRSKGLRLKMLLSFMVLIFVTTLIMFGLTYSNSRQLAMEKVHHRIDLLANIFSRNIDDEIAMSRKGAERFAADETVRALKPGDTLPKSLARQYLNSTGYDDADILLKSGGGYECLELLDNDVNEDEPCKAPEVNRALAGRETILFTIPHIKNSSIFLAAPIIGKDNDVTGLALIGKKLNTTRFGETIKEKNFGHGTVDGYLIDSAGRILSGRDGGLVGKNIYAAGMPLHGYRGLLPKMERPGLETPFFYKGVKYIGAAARVNRELGWTVVIFQPYKEVFEAVRRLSMRILFVGSLALLVAFGLAMYRSHRIIAPIGDLLDAADEIASGEYGKRVKVHRRDEVGSLALAFNRMSAALQEKITAHQHSQEQLKETFHQLQIDSRKRERKVRELMSISEITSAISNSLDINIVLTTIIKTINNVMGFPVCSIKLLNHEDSLVIMVSNGLAEEYVRRAPTKLGRGISGQAVEQRRGIVIEDLEKDERVPPDHVLRTLGIKSMCCIPLMTKQSVLGALNIYTNEHYIFSEDEMRLLSTLANQASSAIENARLFDQLQIDALKRERKVRELMSISEITSAISNSLDINVIMTTITKTISEVMGFTTCSIKLLDKNTGLLEIMVSSGLSDAHLNRNPTRLGKGISGKAVEGRQTIIIENIPEDPRVPEDHDLRKLGIVSLCCIPLMTKQSVLGALNIYTYEKYTFSEDEMRLLSILANQAASAIENARLFDDLRENYFNTIEALSMTIDAKDEYTHGHSKRVSEISVLIGRQMELGPEDLQMIKHAGDLHDIGKIGISEAIIGKEGKLTVDEYEIIKTHPLVGETIIEPVPFLKEVKKVIRHHHERHDGYGYPDGIKGLEIPLMARILHLADAYDAMTSDRPYRKALSRSMAVVELSKHSGTQFDPEVVEAFLKIDDEAFVDI